MMGLPERPRRCDRLTMEFGHPPGHAIRFSSPDCPGLITTMLPLNPDMLTPEERETWQAVIKLQGRAGEQVRDAQPIPRFQP